MKIENYKSKISSDGITLIEIIIAIFIIVLFSLIITANFPGIQRQFALSRTAYKLAQDLRKAQNMALSGIKMTDGSESPMPISVQGYGVYIDLSNQPTEQYLIYADVDGDQKYDGGSASPIFCSNVNQASNGALKSDCVVEIIDVSKENPNLFIESISNISSTYTSINFKPPDPTVNIDNRCLSCPNGSTIGIKLGLATDSSSERTVQVNTSGLIGVK